MRSRQSIAELFTTFLQFDANKVIGWATDARLRRNINNHQKALSKSENSEDFWVSYWYKQWQNQTDNLARGHLSAYLQEVCYWAANKTVTHFSSGQYTLSDCFQAIVTKTDKVLQGFKPDMGFNIKNYASAIFSSELKELLRQQKEVDISTDWRLLRKLTQKRLVESLENAGLNAQTIESYVLAWKCYQAMYAPRQEKGTRKLARPDDIVWQNIAQLYNRDRHSQLSQPGVECSGETIEKWLISCAKAVRAYLYPNMASLNATSGDNSGEFQDILPQLRQESLLSEIVAQEEIAERKSQQSQISDVIIAAIKELNEEEQNIIKYYYQGSLTQSQIAKELGVKQYTISRKLSKCKDTLLLKLATWSKESLHISLNSSLLDYMSTLLEEWLETYYKKQ
ncbi:MAG: sigma-70 family RNA polymerase sigma factor [Richelia sp. SM2_1_7]|nr:sigma-70 family RNA polymerase sigma factor [Richelia sp. SM2_1_7]